MDGYRLSCSESSSKLTWPSPSDVGIVEEDLRELGQRLVAQGQRTFGRARVQHRLEFLEVDEPAAWSERQTQPHSYKGSPPPGGGGGVEVTSIGGRGKRVSKSGVGAGRGTREGCTLKSGHVKLTFKRAEE